ncbi:20 kDa calcium-binding protein-like isoform X2 [Biomphalaria pfeifferi]|uniref:20 kDa calcium-binding protein-like isoform X2 n=1 Tax=Biomphalaria pfeifferi TaxID=112525 RepID=A0AAD8EV66_BIOPF|nr:20 kDa calcium-binding protein-like isoform X2 [Biomphalaria pfeifferi]
MNSSVSNQYVRLSSDKVYLHKPQRLIDNNLVTDESPNANVDFFDEFFSQLSHILKDKDEETCYKEMFRILDDNRKGAIPCEDLRGILKRLQSQVQMTDQELDELIDDIDKNKDGKVDFSEFYKFMLKE